MRGRRHWTCWCRASMRRTWPACRRERPPPPAPPTPTKSTSSTCPCQRPTSTTVGVLCLFFIEKSDLALNRPGQQKRSAIVRHVFLRSSNAEFVGWCSQLLTCLPSQQSNDPMLEALPPAVRLPANQGITTLPKSLYIASTGMGVAVEHPSTVHGAACAWLVWSRDEHPIRRSREQR